MLTALLFTAAMASAAPAAPVPFESHSFEALQKSGKPVVVVIAADWCPSCRAQSAALKSILARPEFASLTLVRVDFDDQKDAVKSFRAFSQSTLIVFKNGKEVGRTVGDADKERLTELIKRAI